jgi:hypothetical protein
MVRNFFFTAVDLTSLYGHIANILTAEIPEDLEGMSTISATLPNDQKF